MIEDITNYILVNSDTIAEYSKIIWGFVSSTVLGASILVAFTKTRNNKLYKLFEALALVVGKTKDQPKK